MLLEMFSRKELINLMKYYFEIYDDKYFEGILKKKCRGLSFSLNTAPGSVGTYWIDTSTIGLSPKYIQNIDILKSVLLHEMIHAWIICVLKDLKCSHCEKFIRKMNEINRKENLKIPITIESDIDSFSQNIDTTQKLKYKYWILIIKTNSDWRLEIFATTINQKMILYLLQQRINYLKRIKTQKIYIFLSDNPLLNLFPIRKKLNLKLESASEKIVSNILSSGENITIFEIDEVYKLKLKYNPKNDKVHNDKSEKYILAIYYNSKELRGRQFIPIKVDKLKSTKENIQKLKSLIHQRKTYHEILDIDRAILVEINSDDKRYQNFIKSLKSSRKLNFTPKNYLIKFRVADLKDLIKNYSFYSLNLF